MPLMQPNNIKYEDFLKIDENTNEYLEFINGKIYNMASPSLIHQMILTKLSTFFGVYFDGKDCFHINSPFDIVLKNDREINKVQPDLTVICDKKGLNDKNYEGTPDLIIEVLSPSSTSRDFVTKMDLYMRFGVKEYWIISPDKKQVYVYNFENNILKSEPLTIRENELLKSNIFDGLEIDLSKIF